ncbi:MAG: hypothetical protein U0350_32330 [Caldilineaceae bacterium]
MAADRALRFNSYHTKVIEQTTTSRRPQRKISHRLPPAPPPTQVRFAQIKAFGKLDHFIQHPATFWVLRASVRRKSDMVCINFSDIIGEESVTGK